MCAVQDSQQSKETCDFPTFSPEKILQTVFLKTSREGEKKQEENTKKGKTGVVKVQLVWIYCDWFAKLKKKNSWIKKDLEVREKKRQMLL